MSPFVKIVVTRYSALNKLHTQLGNIPGASFPSKTILWQAEERRLQLENWLKGNLTRKKGKGKKWEKWEKEEKNKGGERRKTKHISFASDVISLTYGTSGGNWLKGNFIFIRKNGREQKGGK